MIPVIWHNMSERNSVKLLSLHGQFSITVSNGMLHAIDVHVDYP